MRWSDEEKTYPLIFEKGHMNRGRDVARFFGTVCHVGYVTEVIPRRKGFYYKVTYEDGDQEDMDEVFSGVSEEGSVYDSEDDIKALKESKKKRKAVVAMAAARSTATKQKATKWTVCPESVANDGGSESMLGKTLSW